MAPYHVDLFFSVLGAGVSFRVVLFLYWIWRSSCRNIFWKFSCEPNTAVIRDSCKM